MPATSIDIPAVFDDDFSVEFSLHIEMSESEGGLWLDHPNVADNYAGDCDSVGLNIMKSDPHPSPPTIVSEEDQDNHYKDPFAPYQCNLQCQHPSQQWWQSRHDNGQLQFNSNFSLYHG